MRNPCNFKKNEKNSRNHSVQCPQRVDDDSHCLCGNAFQHQDARTKKIVIADSEKRIDKLKTLKSTVLLCK